VACQSSTDNLELRNGAVVSAAPGWQVQCTVTGRRITVHQSAGEGQRTKIVASEALQSTVI